MSLPNLGAMRAVADRLDGLGLEYAFLGGSIVNLLLDDPAFAPTRPTDDVDVILETVTSQRYSEVEAKLRGLGFSHDVREKAPKCRWMLGNLTVDIMPTQGAELDGRGHVSTVDREQRSLTRKARSVALASVKSRDVSLSRGPCREAPITARECVKLQCGSSGDGGEFNPDLQTAREFQRKRRAA